MGVEKLWVPKRLGQQEPFKQNLGESWVKLLFPKVAVKLSRMKCLPYAFSPRTEYRFSPALELVQWELLMFLFRILLLSLFHKHL